MMPLLFGSMLTFVGTLLVCFSMRKHFRQLLPAVEHTTPKMLVLQLAGYLLMYGGIVALGRQYDKGIGLVVFFGVLTVSIFLIAMLLPGAVARISKFRA
ncbi:MAG: DUF3325 family protein [Pseudomonadota bacterium]